MNGISRNPSGKAFQTGILLSALTMVLAACVPKPSAQTTRGSMELMLTAAKAGDVSKMKSYCKGAAVDQCEQLLAAIADMEKTGKASKLDSWNISVTTMPTGSRSNGYADLLGVAHDLFMRVSVTFERDEKGLWKIDQMVWESKRQE